MGVGECPSSIGKDFLKEGVQLSCKSKENNDKQVRAKRAAYMPRANGNDGESLEGSLTKNRQFW